MSTSRSTPGGALGQEHYNNVYREGGWEGVYRLHYRHSPYFPMFRYVLAELKRFRARQVLEVGCGNGAFAQMLMEHLDVLYWGFDFSSIAIEHAIARTRRPDVFFQGDALDPSSYKREYDAIVCTEVLEHVELDRELISEWRTGVKCVCSVPDFDAVGHVRHFRTEEEIRARYGALLEIERVRSVRQPVLSDLSWNNFFRQLRWHRNQPKRVLQILNIAYLKELGAWYVFTGVRKSSRREL